MRAAPRPRSVSCADPGTAAIHIAIAPDDAGPLPPTDRDQLYGYGPLAHLCEEALLGLFACPPTSSRSPSTAGTRPPHPRPPAPASEELLDFIAYALYRVRLPAWVVYHALYLLRRLKARFPLARGSCGQRLFIAALMLASKTVCDDTYSNRSWTIVAQGAFSLADINTMEAELFAFLAYRVNIAPAQLAAFATLLESGHLATALHCPVALQPTPAPASALTLPSQPQPSCCPHAHPIPIPAPARVAVAAAASSPLDSGLQSASESASVSGSGSGSGSTTPSSVPDDPLTQFVSRFPSRADADADADAHADAHAHLPARSQPRTQPDTDSLPPLSGSCSHTRC